MRILVIEDEPRMSALLYKGLSEHGHEVEVAPDGAHGLKVSLDRQFDVVLLDLGLPGLSGYDVAQVFRERRCPASILMLTAYNQEDEIVRGLTLGADDYLTKPFSFSELLARLRAITRPAAAASFVLADLVIDLTQRKVTRQGRAIELTRTEYLLLDALVQGFPKLVSRVALMEAVWSGTHGVTDGALDVLVNSLRGKIDGCYASRLLRTVRGSGYMLEADAAARRSNLPNQSLLR